MWKVTEQWEVIFGLVDPIVCVEIMDYETGELIFVPFKEYQANPSSGTYVVKNHKKAK